MSAHNGSIARDIEKLFFPRAGSRPSLHELEDYDDLLDVIKEHGGVRMESNNRAQQYEFEDESCISIYGNRWIAKHAMCRCFGAGHNRLCPFDVEPDYDPGAAYEWV